MAKEKEVSQETQGSGSDKGLFTVETLRDRFGTPISVYYGIVTMKDWRAGKKVTEDEYRQALTDFNAARTGKGADNA